MKTKFFAIGIFALLFAAQLAAHADAKSAKDKVPLFTRKTLQIVKFETFGGYAGTRSLLTIQVSPDAASVELQSNARGRTEEQTAPLEAAEVDGLLRVLNAANLPKLDGKNFRQQNLFDGFNEILTVALRNGKSFTVQNYGAEAPPEYSAIVRYVRELQ